MANIVNINTAMIDFMKQCPAIEYMYEVFSEMEDGTQLFEPTTTDNYITTYIDGRKRKRLDFTISNFVSITTNSNSTTSENILEIEEMQEIINWFNLQVKKRNYPNFGDFVEIDEMYSLQAQPNLAGVNYELSPPLAQYTLSFSVEYIEDEDALLEEYEKTLI